MPTGADKAQRASRRRHDNVWKAAAEVLRGVNLEGKEHIVGIEKWKLVKLWEALDS